MVNFFKIFDVIFSIAKGVQHDGWLPFRKPGSVSAHYVRIVIVFAIGEINILLLSKAVRSWAEIPQLSDEWPVRLQT